MSETKWKLRPTRNNVYVEKIALETTKGGIVLPIFGAFMGHSARKKTAATPDYFKARVLAVGPEVRDIVEGDEVIIHTYAEGGGTKLFTGENVGEKRRLMVKADTVDTKGDILCVVGPE